MENIIINYQPSRSDLDTLEKWLLKEYQFYGKGFHSNWEVIESAFLGNELILLNRADDVIGFTTWGKYNIFSVIDLMEIREDCRGLGYGKFLFDAVEKLMIDKNAVAIKIFCEPRVSQHFWRRMDFIQFHKGKEYTNSDLTFYKPLIEVHQIAKNTSKDRLELWDLKPRMIGEESPKWIWNLDTENEKLRKPILHPCSEKWQFRLFRNGEKIREDRVRYLTKRGGELFFGKFLFIETILI